MDHLGKVGRLGKMVPWGIRDRMGKWMFGVKYVILVKVVFGVKWIAGVIWVVRIKLVAGVKRVVRVNRVFGGKMGRWDIMGPIHFFDICTPQFSKIRLSPEKSHDEKIFFEFEISS